MSAETPVALRAAAAKPTPTSRMPRRGLLVAFLAALLAVGSLAAAPAPASAAGVKVAIVVGPAGSLTGTYLRAARGYAAQARSYGATVVEVYTPNATWARVRSAVQGANLLVLLGHGNGFPNPYNATLTPLKVDGFGLNGSPGSGNVRTTYFGEYYVRTQVKLAPNAVVILNHLCYSAGNSEPGRAAPTAKVAKQRIDYYASGMMKTGARAVFAEPKGSAGYILTGLFKSSKTLRQVFLDHGAAPTTFNSTRVPGATATAKLTVRALTTFANITAAEFRAAGSTP